MRIKKTECSGYRFEPGLRAWHGFLILYDIYLIKIKTVGSSLARKRPGLFYFMTLLKKVKALNEGFMHYLEACGAGGGVYSGTLLVTAGSECR